MEDSSILELMIDDQENLPFKKIKFNSTCSSSGSITPQVISFGCPEQKTNLVETSLNFSNQNMDEKEGFKRKANVKKDNVLAEQERRQKLSERLIALSTLLPGLKKANKATILEDAIKHLKQLQEGVKRLEEEKIGNNKMDQSVLLGKRSQIYMDNDSQDEISSFKQTMPMVEARVSDKDLLIRIHSEKSKDCLVKILSSLEKFRLEIVNSFTLPFGNSTLIITILSKMDSKFSHPIEDVLKNIRLVLAE